MVAIPPPLSPPPARAGSSSRPGFTAAHRLGGSRLSDTLPRSSRPSPQGLANRREALAGTLRIVRADRLLRGCGGWRRTGWVTQPAWEPVARAFAETMVPDLGKRHSDPTDEQLLVAYREGDRAAFEDLIGRYRHELLNFLTRFLGSRAAAEDVFQETFLQIHLSADSFDETRTFKPWLFTIAANKARDQHRRQKRRQAASLSAPVGNHDEGASFVDLLPGNDETPDEPVARAEESARIKAVVEALPSHYREILLLSYFHRMSYQQIAETLAVPLGTVKSRLHSAVATFADQWRIAQSRSGPRDATS